MCTVVPLLTVHTGCDLRRYGSNRVNGLSTAVAEMHQSNVSFTIPTPVHPISDNCIGSLLFLCTKVEMSLLPLTASHVLNFTPRIGHICHWVGKLPLPMVLILWSETGVWLGEGRGGKLEMQEGLFSTSNTPHYALQLTHVCWNVLQV